MRQLLEGWHRELLRQRIDTRMFQQLGAVLVNVGDTRVGLEAAVVDAAREVFAVVEVLEDGADGFEVFVGEGDGAVLDWGIER